MKKLLIASLLLALFGLATPAHAAWQDSANAAINSGNMNQLNVIAANNPGIQGELAMFLLQKAQDKYKSNPDLAAKIFVAAQPFISQIPPGEQSKAAAGLLRSVESQAKESGFQQKDCRGAVTVLGASLNMSSLPNIVSAAPNLHADILSDANDSIEKNPACDTKELNLAQLPVTPTPPSTRPLPPFDPPGDTTGTDGGPPSAE